MNYLPRQRSPFLSAPAVLLLIAALGLGPVAARAQRTAPAASQAAASLVFTSVTVVDVEQGKLLPDQQVVITGNRIRAMGPKGAAQIPEGAELIDAKGKYLIPGLWDLHVHTSTDLAYPLYVASGVTGFRDAWAYVPLDTMQRWRREIQAGTRVGPPRQILSGVALHESPWCSNKPLSMFRPYPGKSGLRGMTGHVCFARGDVASARRLVDTLKTLGVDMLKLYDLSPPTSFAIMAYARQLGMPFGGHAMWEEGTPAELENSQLEATIFSDSGSRIIDHVGIGGCWQPITGVRIADFRAALHPGQTLPQPDVECAAEAARFQRNGTWFVPTMSRAITVLRQGRRSQALTPRTQAFIRQFWHDTLVRGNWLRDPTPVDSLGSLHVMQRWGLPILAGTDMEDWAMPNHGSLPGFAIHTEIATYVSEGMTPLAALQTATLNPAKLLHATDSLGTVAPGKLADLVLLDANPLDDITNTTTIRAVVANGRYFDRDALDQLLTEVQQRGKNGFKYWWETGAMQSTMENAWR